MGKMIYIEYLDGTKTVSGMFELMEQTASYVRIKSGRNIIVIPYHKLNKMKEKL